MEIILKKGKKGGKNKKSEKNKEVIKFITLKELVLVGKEGEIGCFSRIVVKGDVLCLNIRVNKGEEDEEGGEVIIFKKGGEAEFIEFINLKKLEISVRNVFRFELQLYL